MQFQRRETAQGTGPLILSCLCPRTFYRLQVSPHKGSLDTGRMEILSPYPQRRGLPPPHPTVYSCRDKYAGEQCLGPGAGYKQTRTEPRVGAARDIPAQPGEPGC